YYQTRIATVKIEGSKRTNSTHTTQKDICMLPRVAAAMASRTHNRRRVTGSSGRRREGGESERQRPNMSRRVFTSAVLLLLVVMCCGSGTVTADEAASNEPSFEWKSITGTDVTVVSLGVPDLLKVGSDVFVVSEAQCKKGENTFTGVASKLLTTATTNKPVEVLNEAKDTQVLEKAGSQEQKTDVSRPTTVVKGSDVYMLVGKYSRTAVGGALESDAGEWGILLVKGEVSGDEKGVNSIHWKNTNNISRPTFEEQHALLTQVICGGGSGVETNDHTLVFPVEATKKNSGQDEAAGGKNVSLLMYTSDDSSWKLSKGMSADGCSHLSVVEWKGKLMMMTACDGCRRVYESGDMGDLWTEALGTLSCVWGNKKDEKKRIRSGFITATLGDDVNNKKNVMLVTLPVYSKKAKKEKDNENGALHLWLTDNTHIVDIGPVSGDEDEDVAASSLLYKSAGSGDNNEDKLIVLYEKKKGGAQTPSPGMVSVLLTAQLEQVKKVLATWKEVDERVSNLCPPSGDEKDRAAGTACSDGTITDGLVGFLSGKFSENTWRDEYLGVNATVKGNGGTTVAADAARVTESSDGVTFRGAWAEWPVGAQGENQLYHFANYNFTLVATVSIDGEPEDGSIPLMGVKMNDDKGTVLLGVSYDKEKKWQGICSGKTTMEHSSTLGPEKTQLVVSFLKNGTNCFIYFDGQRVGNAPCELKNIGLEATEPKEISHFYIGGDGVNADGREGVSVTVKNVLLYNRPLDDPEIGAFNPEKAPIPPPVKTPQLTVPQSSGGEQEEQGRLLGRSGAGSVSTSTESTATTSSGEVGSVSQLVSGKPSDGTQRVNGGLLSDGDQRAESEVGDMVQGDGSAVNPEASASSGESGKTAGGTDGQEEDEIHPQDREANATALSSSLGNLSQGNNIDAGTVREIRMLPLLILLLGLWGFAAH
ncbi:trans-sialidase, putative, partial [Trypanosoma cruzi marinkellei]